MMGIRRLVEHWDRLPREVAQSLLGFKCHLDMEITLKCHLALKNILEPLVSPEVGLGDQGRFLPTEIFCS